MVENWAPIPGWETRYEVSDLGRVRSLPFLQRYLLRNGRPALRLTRGRILAQQRINRGYLIVHLHHDDVRVAKLVHRLVAVVFVPGFDVGREVNHKDGEKANNAALNLEWCTRQGNLLHAVSTGLHATAMAVQDPTTGARYPSISQAARAARRSHRTVAAKFQKVA